MSGVVIDGEGRQPLDSVEVTLWGDGNPVYTDASGAYGYYGSLPGLTGVGFEKEGYHNALFNVNLLENDTVALDVALQPLDVNGLY